MRSGIAAGELDRRRQRWPWRTSSTGRRLSAAGSGRYGCSNAASAISELGVAACSSRTQRKASASDSAQNQRADGHVQP